MQFRKDSMKLRKIVLHQKSQCISSRTENKEAQNKLTTDHIVAIF